MKKTLCLLVALGAFAPLSASARPYHLTPVSWIVATRNNIDVDDRYVTIVGHVTRAIGSEEYWFTDGTGSVRLDSENFDLPIGRRIVVGGRIDQAYLGFGHIEVDVRNWHYAPVHHAPVHTVVVTRTVAVPASSAVVPTPAPASAPAPAPVASTPPPAPAPAPTPAPSQPASTNPAPVSQTAPATNASPLTPPADNH